MRSPSRRPLPPLIRKACPIVLRDGAGEAEVLVFAHPRRGTELVKGIVGPEESPAAAALRELREESGLRGRVAAGPIREVAPVEAELWLLVPCAAPGAPDQWIHAAPQADGGHLFRFRWMPVEGPFPEDMDESFRTAIAAFAPSDV